MSLANDDTDHARRGFPIVVPVHERDRLAAQRALRALRKQGHQGPLHVLTKPSAQLNEDLGALGVDLRDENEIVDGLSYTAVESALAEYGALGVRSPGWLFQQFLKMGYARSSHDAYYVVWDADTIALRPHSFIAESGKTVLFQKDENFLPYYEMNRRLLNLSRMTHLSFVAEVMCIRTQLMREMLSEIEERSGLPYWRAILSQLSNDSVISEFELYGNYALARGESIELRAPNSFRFGAKLVGLGPTQSQLDWLSRDFDSVTLESYHDRKIFPALTRRSIFRRLVGARQVCLLTNAVVRPFSRNTWTSGRYFYF